MELNGYKMRARKLQRMDKFLREFVQDEEIFEIWLESGLPDGSDLDDCMEYAYDDDCYYDLMSVFAQVVLASWQAEKQH